MPKYMAGKEYNAFFFHGVNHVTMQFDTKTHSSTIPTSFDGGRRIIIAVIADSPGATTLDSVVAGSLILLQQPASVTPSTLDSVELEAGNPIRQTDDGGLERFWTSFCDGSNHPFRRFGCVVCLRNCQKWQGLAFQPTCHSTFIIVRMPHCASVMSSKL